MRMEISFLFADIDECGGHHRSKRSHFWWQYNHTSGNYIHNLCFLMRRITIMENKISQIIFV